MLVPDDLAAWFVARMNVAAVTAAVSGGFWNGRPGETAVAPYGVFAVTREGQAEYTSAGELPRYMISAAVYADQAAATQAQTTEIAIAGAMPIVYAGTLAMIRNGAGTVIHAEPREWSADTTFPMRAASDVVVCRATWNVFCQATTG